MKIQTRLINFYKSIIVYWQSANELGLNHRRSILIIIVNLCGAILESIGLVAFLPVFQFVEAQGNLSNIKGDTLIWKIVFGSFDLISLQPSLPGLLIFSFICVSGRQLFFYMRNMLSILSRETMIRDTRARLFKMYMYASCEQQESEPVGSVVSNMTYQIANAVDGSLLPFTFLNLIIITLVWLGALTATVGVYTLAAVAGISMAVFVIRKLLYNSMRYGYARTTTYTALLSFLVDRFRAFRLIHLCRLEEAEAAAMSVLNEDAFRADMRLKRAKLKLEGLLEPATLALCFIMLYLGLVYLNLSFEQLGIFLVVAIVRLLPLAKEITSNIQSLLVGHSYIDVVRSQLKSIHDARERDLGKRTINNNGEGFVLNSVSFTYPNALNTALQNISFQIPKGQMTALVGPSGSGKSTLVDLLPRLRIPQSGQITLDAHPLEDYSLASLRQAIAYVPQQPQLFNISIAEHIRLGKADASFEEVKTAAEMVGLGQFIKAMPDGYDSNIGELGGKLSGGQRQRLDIARALVSKALFLILDEPTSSLDAVSEADFRALLQTIKTETAVTIIIIGHRLSTVVNADQIIVLRNSEIVEIGTHQQLLVNKGWYSDAVRQQTTIQPDLTSLPLAAVPT